MKIHAIAGAGISEGITGSRIKEENRENLSILLLKKVAEVLEVETESLLKCGY
jgi:hypothetical protein